jgi:hypothetical protein
MYVGAHLRQMNNQHVQVKLTAFLRQDIGQGSVLSSGHDALAESPVAAHPFLKFKHGLNHWV